MMKNHCLAQAISDAAIILNETPCSFIRLYISLSSYTEFLLILVLTVI
jgi:hypothetical protein